jgi:surface antigen
MRLYAFRRWAPALLAIAVAAPATASKSASLLDYVGQCVPFARAASGIQIYGNAWTWWDQAEGKYERTHVPKEGAVIVFAKTARLPFGHVAVVSRVVEKRVVMLTHANWSDVKVWYKDVDGLGGGIYPVYGFIYGRAHAAAELTSRNPDYVGALIDAYVPVSGQPIAR